MNFYKSRGIMEQKKVGKITTTYKVRLYNKHLNWLENTKLLYNQVLEFYYKILVEHKELLELSNNLLMRELEIMTVGTKKMKAEKKEAEYTLKDFPKIPLYFRRAAINNAVSLMRSYQSNFEMWQKSFIEGQPSQASQFRASPVFYKGMYKDFTEDSITLKLYTGKEWKWISYRYTGRRWSEKAKLLSPTIKVGKKEAWLHVPVEEIVTDIRTVKERMETEQEILAVSFPGDDCMAVCVRMNLEGKELDSYFIRGGREWKAKKKKIYKKIEKVRESRGSNTKYQRQNKEEKDNYYEKMEQLNERLAHLVSRRIVNYSLEHEIKMIIVPNYEKEIEFKKMRFLKTGEYDWIGRKIIRFLKYKSFQAGIVVSTIRPYHISDTCSECGMSIQKYNEGHRPGKKYYGGKLFICPSGHRGNTAENTAKNIGRHFLKSFYGNLVK